MQIRCCRSPTAIQSLAVAAVLLLPLAPVRARVAADSLARSTASADPLTSWPLPAVPLAVTGTVRFEGAAPAPVRLDMSSDPYCAQASAATPAVVRSVEVGPQGGLGGVVVHVRGRVAGSRAAPGEPVVLDQQACMYRPTVIALGVNQPLLIRNSDGTLHNVHVRAKANRSFNLGQPMKGLESRRAFPTPEVGITVSCDVHGWMSGAIAVFDHAYFAVTGADGRFSIDGLPPGDYELEAWHPTLGTQTASVRVTAGSDATPVIVFRAAS